MSRTGIRSRKTMFKTFSLKHLRSHDRAASPANDRSLAHRLHDTFERKMERAEVEGVHFYVHKGVVTVYGTARHALDRDLLIAHVGQIQGVRGVIEHMQIVHAPFQKQAA